MSNLFSEKEEKSIVSFSSAEILPSALSFMIDRLLINFGIIWPISEDYCYGGH